MEQPSLVIENHHLKYGLDVEREIFHFTPDFEERWDRWLDEHFDPGNYDTWKDRERMWSDYIDGAPKRWVQTFLPANFVRELFTAIAEGLRDGSSTP